MGLIINTIRPAQEDGRPRHEYVPTNHHHAISGVGFFATVEINHQPGGYPPDPVQPEDWQIGFIQNVIRMQIIARYDSGREERFNHINPILDAMRHPVLLTPADWQEPWIYYTQVLQDGNGHELRGFANFKYGGGQRPSRIRLSMVDYPRASFYNVFSGGSGGDQLRNVEERVDFGLWIAAKRVSDHPQNLNNYIGLAMAQFTFITQLRISGHNPYWVPGNNPPPSLQFTVQPSQYSINFTQVLRPNSPTFRPNRSRPRIISGPMANAVLPRLVNNAGISPRYRFWR